MADPTTYRPKHIPTDPGVYKFLDEHQRVIYVGKAKNLRARLSNYFQDLSQLHPRTRQMVTTACNVEWTVVASEVEALQLEYTWIKRFDPRFNVKYRDDKSYPVLAVSVGERFPRAFFYRGAQRRGVRYFGPYSHAWAVRETIDLLTRVFPMRTCAAGVFRRHEALGRPCLLGYIDKCSAPCVGRVTEDEHRAIVDEFCAFMSGKTQKVVAKLQKDMNTAAEALDFELAAKLRDDLLAIEKITEQQAVVFGDGTDADVLAVEADALELAIQMFHVRQGRIRGQRGWVVERVGDDDASVEQQLQDFLVQFYSDAAAEEVQNTVVPREILVSVLPAQLDATHETLQALRGAQVDVRVPQRGDKRALMETVQKNAQEAMRQHKLRRIGDLTARSQALREIQEYLGLEEPPLRIECTDISHIQGTDIVASLVVFEDGLPKKSDYRRYHVNHTHDVANIAEVTRRRFQRQIQEEETEQPKRFAYPPQLFIVDGGAPQVAAAYEELQRLELNIPVVGIAKRLEEVWLPNDPYPVIFPRNSAALHLIQHIRDEAHRVAITFHRQQRSKRMKKSVLDDVKGLGTAKRAVLMKHFGSLRQLKEASVEEIAEVKGFGPTLAAAVFDALHPAK